MNDNILYYPNGAPYIFSNYYISISHSCNLVSLAISNYRIGIDIEKNRLDNIFKIKDKFVNRSEDYYNNLLYESDYLHIIWGIKEGLFKLHYKNSWSFSMNYRVDFFKLKFNNVIYCWILNSNKSKKYYAFYKKISNYFLVYVLDYNPNINVFNIMFILNFMLKNVYF